MALRSTVAAFRCQGRFMAASRAVLGDTTLARHIVAAPTSKLSTASLRALSTSVWRLTASEENGTSQEESMMSEIKQSQASTNGQNAASTPWFLEVEPPRHAPSPHTPALPQVPSDVPPLLDPIIKYVYNDMGLDDLALMDLRELDPPAALGPNLIMLFATARSERHLHISSSRFVRWLWRNYRVTAQADGLIGPGELKTKLRRLRKKAKIMGTNTMLLPRGDNGLSSAWVCVNFSTCNQNFQETAKFDENGKQSGFGSVITGTTVVVQCLTEARRSELALETLWRDMLSNSLDKERRLKGEETDEAELESLVSSKIQLPLSLSSAKWKPSQPNFQQQRLYSSLKRPERWRGALGKRETRPSQSTPEFLSSCKPCNYSHDGMSRERPEEPAVQAQVRAVNQRSLHLDAASALQVREGNTCIPQKSSQVSVSSKLGHATDTSIPDTDDKLTALKEQILAIHVRLSPLDQTTLEALVVALLLVESSRPNSAMDRLALVDLMLLTGQERGFNIQEDSLLVALVEAMLNSPAYGPHLIRSLRNLELLLAEKQVLLSEDQLRRLMLAYARRQDWDRFWDTFRSPPRFKASRPKGIYELAYRIMSTSGNPGMCKQALRWVYAEMLREDPLVLPLGSIYEPLRACILMVDPSAEELLHNPPLPDGRVSQQRLRRREFKIMLGQVESFRKSSQMAMEKMRQDKVLSESLRTMTSSSKDKAKDSQISRPLTKKPLLRGDTHQVDKATKPDLRQERHAVELDTVLDSADDPFTPKR